MVQAEVEVRLLARGSGVDFPKTARWKCVRNIKSQESQRASRPACAFHVARTEQQRSRALARTFTAKPAITDEPMCVSCLARYYPFC
jgi:hypothetical protein